MGDVGPRKIGNANFHANSWPDAEQQPTDDNVLRHEQLKVRLFEMYHVVEVLKTIAVNGSTDRCRLIRGPDAKFDWPKWQCLSLEKPVVIGHSFGGSAALAASARPERFSFRSAVAFDPAIERGSPSSFSLLADRQISARSGALDVDDWHSSASH